MTVTTVLPRTVVGVYLKAARLPIDVASKVTHQEETWPPALAFDRLEANVDTLLGGLLKDQELIDRGRLMQARVEQLRKAATLRTVAEQERAAADSELEERRRRAEKQREETEQRAAQREQEIAKKAAAVRQTEAAQQKAVARQERKAKQAALTKQAEALDKAKEAVEADQRAALVEDAIEASKQARKLP